MDEDGVGPVCLANLGRDRCAVPSEHLSADMTLIIVNYLIYKVFPFSLIKTYYFSEIAIPAVRLQKQIANQNFISFYRLLTMYGRAPLLLILLYRIRLVSTLVRFSYSQPISLSSLSMWSSLSFMSPFPLWPWCLSWNSLESREWLSCLPCFLCLSRSSFFTSSSLSCFGWDNAKPRSI